MKLSFSPEITWDAFKACSRGHYIASISAAHKEREKLTFSLQRAVDYSSAEYATDPSETNFDNLRASQRDLHLHMTEATRLDLYRTRQNIFEQGDCNGCLLAMLAHHDRPLTRIPEIKLPEGGSVSSPQGDA